MQHFRVPHRCVHPVNASFDYDVIDAAGKPLFQFVTGRSQQPETILLFQRQLRAITVVIV